VSLNLYLESPTRKEMRTCGECGHECETEVRDTFFSINITHNVNGMFEAAGLYQILWHGDGLIAGEQVPALEVGLLDMEKNPDHYKQFDAPNGWGTYVQALPWLREVLNACRAHPTALLRCSR
jgi:hypothetical protein